MIEPGASLGPERYAVRRSDLIRYAGASGDFNPIHWSDRVAKSVGLPGVIAHGMYTMALAGRAVTTWAGEATVVELAAKFTKPVVVPDDDDGVVVEVSGTAREADAEGRVRVDLTVTCEGQKVLGMARAVVADA